MLLVGVIGGLGMVVAASITGAAPAPVGLGTAGTFAVLAGTGVTNTGPSVVNGDLGTCPTPAVTGFPPGAVNGTTHANDAVACQAKSDLVIAYNDAAGRAPTTTYPGPTDLVGMTLTAGVYSSPSSLALGGTLTLDAQGDAGAVFIFQAASTLITAPNSTVSLVNGAQACNVFWVVGSSATLGVGSTFVGTIMALTSISANTNALVQGRLLARNGATTLDTNTVSPASCVPMTTSTTAVSTTSTLPATTTTAAPTTTSTAAPAATTTSMTAPVTTTTSTTAPVTTTTAAATGVTTTTTAASASGTTTTTLALGGTSTTAPVGASTTTASVAAGPTGTTPSAGTGSSTVPVVSAPTATTATTTVLDSVGSATSSSGAAATTTTGASGGSATVATIAGSEALARSGFPTWEGMAVASLAIALGALLVVTASQRKDREGGTGRFSA